MAGELRSGRAEGVGGGWREGAVVIHAGALDCDAGRGGEVGARSAAGELGSLKQSRSGDRLRELGAQ
jgi:hypothetical protein